MGDKLYGQTDPEFIEWRDRPVACQSAPLTSRQALHAESLRFIHPWTGEEVMVSAPMPDDMKRWLGGG